MARPATGAPRWNAAEGYWEARISIPGRDREPVPMRGIPKCASATPTTPTTCPCEHCARARRVAKIISDKARVEGRVPEETAETANEWFKRYVGLHAKLGNLVRGTGAWDRWMGPHLGTTPIANVKRDQIIAVRDAMTRATVEKKISAKRAANLWSELVKAPFSRAFSDDDPKYSGVRVGPGNVNPTIGIKPPVTNEDKENAKKERQPLLPREFAKLIACSAIPIEWRRLYAVAVYLFARPEELYAFRWTDVDWDAQEVRVRRALDMRTGKEKRPKTKEAIREIPIHPHLMPLLMQMRAEAGGTEAASNRIVPLATRTRDVEKNATMIRTHVGVAGIERTELVNGTEDHMALDFRSCRTTGITWHAMLETDSWALARWSGHKSPDITWASYAKEGPDRRRRHGEPFPALGALLSPLPCSGGDLVKWSGEPAFSAAILCEGGDLNLAPARPDPSREIAREPEESAAEVTPHPTSDMTAAAETQRPDRKPAAAGSVTFATVPTNPDELLRAAIKACLDAGDLDRATALLDVLKSKPNVAPVVNLLPEARRRGMR